MSYRKFNLSILENIVNTQYGDFGGLVQIDRSDLYSFSELCKEKGIDMEKYFLLGMHFGTSSLTNVGNDDSFYCFALVLEREKYGNSFDEISNYLSNNENKAEIKQYDFSVTYSEFSNCIKRFSVGFVTPLSKYIKTANIEQIL